MAIVMNHWVTNEKLVKVLLVTKVFIKSAGSCNNIMLKYAAVYTDLFIRFLVVFVNLKKT